MKIIIEPEEGDTIERVEIKGVYTYTIGGWAYDGLSRHRFYKNLIVNNDKRLLIEILHGNLFEIEHYVNHTTER